MARLAPGQAQVAGRLAVILAAAALAALALASGPLLRPPSALAVSVYSEGEGAKPFSLVSQPAELAGGTAAEPSLSLALRPLTIIDKSSPVWQDAPTAPNPRDVCPLDNGHILIADKENKFVAELDAAGKVVWKYDNADGAGFKRPFSVQPATFGGKRCVLIAERLQYRVFAVTWDDAKQVVWQYGTTDEYGLGVNHLMDPFAAVQLAGGNVLISDENSGNRVIEVRASDYDPSAADLGYTAQSIVWQYGTPGVAGVALNQVDQPRWPQRLENGPGSADDTTLFTDSNGQRVLEVRDGDYDPAAENLGYSAASTLWSYGSSRLSGVLHNPNRATRILSGPMTGTTVIADSDGHRILWVSPEGQVTRSLDTGAFDAPEEYATNGSDPRSAVYGSDWSLWVADPGYHRIIRVGYEPEAAAEWRALDCGKPGRAKAFLRLTLRGQTADQGSDLDSFAVSYSVDNGATWRAAKLKSGRLYDFPRGTAGKSLSLRVTLRSNDRWHTPTLDGFSLQYTAATSGPVGGGGGGQKAGDAAKPRPAANSGTDDGVYTYPGVSGSSGSGGGTGSGSSGYGGGSGTSGTGSGGTASGPQSVPAASGIVAPPTSVAAADKSGVTGIQVEGLEGVSGIALKAAPDAHLAEKPRESSQTLPVGAAIVVSLGALAGLLLPWPFLAARLREVGGFDHTRPRRYPSSRLLG